MGSSRLPGKVLKLLAGRPVIEHVLRRAMASKRADAICLATTREAIDDPLEEVARALGVSVFRGSETDVLGRFAGAARMMKADIVVRVTCDCPLLDPSVVDAVIDLRESTEADYASNGLVMDWPDGLDCEAFTAAVLFAADKAARDPYEREHVTPWIRTTGAQQKAHLPGPGKPQADQRWTLDSPEDYAFLAALFELLPALPALPGWQEIISVIESHGELGALNDHLRRTALPR